jgi:hypothetical protein
MSKLKRIFISYSHNDKNWMSRVVKPMQEMQDKGEWELRYDISDIKAGDDWESKIETSLKLADAAILLVSKQFLTSEFIRKNEIPPLLERKENEDVKVIPLIIGPCDWQKEEWLKAIEVRPKDKSLEELPDDVIDTFLLGFVLEIKEALKEGAKIRILLNEKILDKNITFGVLHVRDGKDEVQESGPLLNDELFFKDVASAPKEKEVVVNYRGNLGFQFKCFADYEDSGLSLNEVAQLLEENGFRDIREGGAQKKRVWFLLEGFPTYTTVDHLINNFFYPA